jgi:hypothetical protein
MHYAVLVTALAVTAAAARGWTRMTFEQDYTKAFNVTPGSLSATGRSTYFILEPGYQSVFEGQEDGKKVELVITVLDATRKVDGVETRIVEERETSGGQLAEVSRNYFAISKTSGDVYYFGEEVDIYKDGKITSHEGAWESGVKGAKFGLAMPGDPKVGMRYYQEVAPGVAMDRAEVVSITEVVEVPAGRFEKCLKTLETTPLEPDTKESKYYAPGIGLIRDGPARLVRSGPRAK